MIITISGHAGSGKSTVADILAKKLRFTRYSVGDLRREMAQSRGLTLDQYNKLGETDANTDKEADTWAQKLGKKEDNFIIDGRVAWHFIPHSFKIFLDVDPKVAAERSFKDHQAGKRTSERKLDSVQAALDEMKERQLSDVKRYKKYYGIRYDDPKYFNLVIDTSKSTIKETVNKIMNEIKKLKK